MSNYTRSNDWLYRPVFEGSEGVLIPLYRQKADLTSMYVMNETALFVWEQLTSPLSENELANRLSAEFDLSDEVSLEEVRRDAEECLQELVQLGAVQLSP
jgi:hypothetical protein